MKGRARPLDTWRFYYVPVVPASPGPGYRIWRFFSFTSPSGLVFYVGGRKKREGERGEVGLVLPHW